MNRALITTPLALIALIALVGCGGGDDEPGADAATAEAIPSAEWIKQADEICQTTDEQVGAIGGAQNLKDVARVADEIQALVSDELQRLRELPPPEEIGDQVEEMLRLEELEVSSFDAVEDAASTGDNEQLQSVYETATQPGDESNRIAKSLGMEECEEPHG